MSDDSQYTAITRIIETFVDGSREELLQRWKHWSIDLARGEVHEVIGALLARQVTLATQPAQSPAIWNGHIAPLILRAMADVYIALAWVLKEPDARARKFVLYGLGQEKLQLEHRKTQLAEREPTPEEQLMIEASEAGSAHNDLPSSQKSTWEVGAVYPLVKWSIRLGVWTSTTTFTHRLVLALTRCGTTSHDTT